MANNINHSQAKHSKMYPNFSLRGRVYVITGGARGIGLAMAEAMTEGGADGK
jgi:NADP-dependent 3-hydroxy acid dehydrogenase YdfG